MQVGTIFTYQQNHKNSETYLADLKALGYDMQTLESAYAPYCTTLQTIVTAESFDDLK